jgi:hypothetical protein
VTPDELDRAVSVALRSRAEQVQTTGDPLPGVEARARRLGRNRLLVSVLPALVGAAAAGSVALAVALSGGNAPHPTTGTTGSPTGSTTGSPTGSPTVAGPTASVVDSESPTAATGVSSMRDDALRRQLAGNPDVTLQMIGHRTPIGRVFCGITVVGADAAKSHLYTWVLCGDFTVGSNARLGSASAEPAVLTVTGQGAGIHLTHVDFPRQAHLQRDITRMFPPGVAAVMRAGNISVTPDEAQLLEEARRAD